MAHLEGEAVDLTEEEIKDAWEEALKFCNSIIPRHRQFRGLEREVRLNACASSLFQTKLGKKVAEKKG